ncbi:MAG: oligosaccharide flippase family protein [Propionivibrio sp.]|nr:oligosaccharide flippase family protein [Propionivibrio sp.]
MTPQLLRSSSGRKLSSQTQPVIKMTSIRKSLLLSFAQRNSTLVIQFVSSLIIARLLTPHEIGIFSIGAVVVSFSHIVRDMGVSNYVIQERNLTTDRIRSAQAIVWITSWSLALLLFLLAGWAGEFYAERGVTLTMQVLAISFLLLPVGSVTVALLTREMAFGQLFVINICSTLTQALTGVLLAWAGYGFISLAWSAVAGASVSALGSLMCRRPGQPWLPGIREWRRVFAAGTKLSGTSMFYEIGLGGPELIAGRTLGFEAVAYYSRGFGVATMLLRALVDSLLPVAIPYFAHQSRSEQDMKTPYLRGIVYMSGLALPAFACLGAMAESVIVFLFGRQWLEAVMPLQIACAGLACLTVNNVAVAVLVGSGKLGTHLAMQAFFQSTKVLLAAIGAIYFGCQGLPQVLRWGM